MEMFQILSCTNDLATCCSNTALVGFLSILKRIIDIIQFVVPIILIITGTIQFIQMTINPDLKDGFKKILNKLIAVIIIFLLPSIVDVFLNVASGNFTIASCWQQAKVITSTKVTKATKYVKDSDNSLLLNNEKYDEVMNSDTYKSNEKRIAESQKDTTKTSTNKQKEIVSYAKKFLGKKYKFKGNWDGSTKYTPTDCSGFVKGVFKHVIGVNLPHGTHELYRRKDLWDPVSEKNLQPGDVIMYKRHVGIYTGKGKEIIHAKGTGYGILIDKNYNKASRWGKPIGFLRIKGVK